MKKAHWMILAATSGLLLGVGSCVSDIAYYAIDALGTYLPDILDSLGSTTT